MPPQDLSTLNIMPTCRIKTIDDTGDKLKYLIWGVVEYTPANINKVLVDNNLSGAFVSIFGFYEYWERGEHLATKVKREQR